LFYDHNHVVCVVLYNNYLYLWELANRLASTAAKQADTERGARDQTPPPTASKEHRREEKIVSKYIVVKCYMIASDAKLFSTTSFAQQSEFL